MGLALSAGQALSRRRSSRSKASPSEADMDKALGEPAANVGPTRVTCHRKCLLCIFFDDDVDPVEKHFGRQILMFWGRPNGPNGETMGNYCFYCMRIYSANVRGIKGMTVNAYTAQLGKEEKKHDQHLALQRCVIKTIIDRGGVRNGHMNWEALEAESLDVVRSMQAVVKKPGLNIWQLAEYMEEHGSMQTDKGHYLSVDGDGKEVVIVPDRKVTRVEFNDVHSVNRRQQLGNTNEGLDPQMLDTRMRAIADSFEPNFGGRFMSGNGLEAVLGMPGQQASQPATPQEFPVNAAGMATGSGIPAPKPSTPIKAENPDSQSAGAGGSQRPKPKPSGQSGAKAGRGRPKKNLVVDVERLEEQFLKSIPTDICWWGAEAKAIVKSMTTINKEIDARLRTEPNLDAINSLGVAQKKLTSMIVIVDEARQHGLDADAFKSALDLTMTKLNLEPKAHLDLPPHVSYARHKFDIRGVLSIEGWIQHVSSAALKKCGLVNLADEQDKLWSERFSSVLKMKEAEMQPALATMFSLDRELDLEDNVGQFVSSFGVGLTLNTFIDLDQLVELSSEAVSALAAAVPSATSKGTQMGAVLAGIPRGRQLLKEMQAIATKAEHTQKLVRYL